MKELSVVVSAYNAAATVEECLRAIRNSTFDDYELIVVDDGSGDQTRSIAERYADRVISYEKNQGRNSARTAGIQISAGEIIVGVDADIVIGPGVLGSIHAYFMRHPQIDALSGMLAKEHPNLNFFSQYKNLYMHYVFKQLPDKVTFLYGSIFAIRNNLAILYQADLKRAGDTAFGQKLFSEGKQIAFLKDLEVIHLKKYTARSFIINDFIVPYYWSKIFVRYKGWGQIGKNSTGFAHASKSQIISVIIAPAISLSILFSLIAPYYLILAAVLSLVWILLNFRFIHFLAREKGVFFALISFFVTFFDTVFMAIGVMCGLIMTLFCRRKDV